MATLQHHNKLELQPHVMKMHQPETAKSIHVFVNGDQFFAGRKFVLNRRHIPDFDGFLNQVTMGIKPPFGAVRNIYTPTSGHRVRGLEQIKNGMELVAGGVERFRKIEYREIGAKNRPQPRKHFFDLKHHHQRMNVSARWRKYVKDPCQIFVFGNGDINAPAMRLLLIPRCMKTWELVLGEITEKLSLRTGQAVRKLYDLNYRLLLDPSELENGQSYIAVGTEQLKKFPYGDIAARQKNYSNLLRKNQPLPPIKKVLKPRPPTKDDGEQTYTKMYTQKKQMKKQEEATVMGASAATGYRPLKTKQFKPQRSSVGSSLREEDSVFHAKPVKLKRSGGAEAHSPVNIHPPQDGNDGVFRTENDRIDAEEVEDDENVKTDLPVDQAPTDTVEEAIQKVLSGESFPDHSDQNKTSPQLERTIHDENPSDEDRLVTPSSPKVDPAEPDELPMRSLSSLSPTAASVQEEEQLSARHSLQITPVPNDQMDQDDVEVNFQSGDEMLTEREDKQESINDSKALQEVGVAIPSRSEDQEDMSNDPEATFSERNEELGDSAEVTSSGSNKDSEKKEDDPETHSLRSNEEHKETDAGATEIITENDTTSGTSIDNENLTQTHDAEEVVTNDKEIADETSKEKEIGGIENTAIENDTPNDDKSDESVSNKIGVLSDLPTDEAANSMEVVIPPDSNENKEESNTSVDLDNDRTSPYGTKKVTDETGETPPERKNSTTAHEENEGNLKEGEADEAANSMEVVVPPDSNENKEESNTSVDLDGDRTSPYGTKKVTAETDETPPERKNSTTAHEENEENLKEGEDMVENVKTSSPKPNVENAEESGLERGDSPLNFEMKNMEKKDTDDTNKVSSRVHSPKEGSDPSPLRESLNASEQGDIEGAAAKFVTTRPASEHPDKEDFGLVSTTPDDGQST